MTDTELELLREANRILRAQGRPDLVREVLLAEIDRLRAALAMTTQQDALNAVLAPGRYTHATPAPLTA